MVDKFSKAISSPTEWRLPKLWRHFESLAILPNWSWLNDVFPLLHGCFDRLIELIRAFYENPIQQNPRRGKEVLKLADDIRTACLVLTDFIQPLNELVEDGEDDPAAIDQLKAEFHSKMMDKRKWFNALEEKI
jgi:hypothetical protein